MNLCTLQIASTETDIPDLELFQQWAQATLSHENALDKILTIRIVDPPESQVLNTQFRHKNKPTNVLSFPYESTGHGDDNYLGDIAICASVVKQEANEQQKPLIAHWAHMSIHGILHLLGYDHQKKAEAAEMEALEIALLNKLGFENPYE